MKYFIPIKTLLLASIVSVLFCSITVAETEIFGYFESEIDGLAFQDQTYGYGYNKLRIDLTSKPQNNLSVHANINVQQFFGQTTWDLLDFFPAHIRENELSDINSFPMSISDTLYLDNAYIKLHFNQFDITAGRQPISLGVGYSWNPLDVFNQKELTDPTYEQTGVAAFRLEKGLGSRTMFDLIIAPDDTLEGSPIFTQLKTGLGNFDFHIALGTMLWQRNQTDVDSLTSSKIYNRRNIIGGAVVGEIATVGVWSECALNLIKDGEDFTELVIGFDYTFTTGTYLLTEYFYNSFGKMNSEELKFNDYMSYMAGNQHSLMQNYLFNFLNHPLTGYVTIGGLVITNLSDGSMAVGPMLDWNVLEDVNLSFMVNASAGPDNSEFDAQGWGGRLRLRAHF
jgi:hypothetical protein